MWKQYVALPEDRVDQALVRIRQGLDALEMTVERLTPPGP